MITEQQARQAALKAAEQFSGFDGLLGLGVEPLGPDSFCVAFYVSHIKGSYGLPRFIGSDGEHPVAVHVRYLPSYDPSEVDKWVVVFGERFEAQKERERTTNVISKKLDPAPPLTEEQIRSSMAVTMPTVVPSSEWFVTFAPENRDTAFAFLREKGFEFGDSYVNGDGKESVNASGPKPTNELFREGEEKGVQLLPKPRMPQLRTRPS